MNIKIKFITKTIQNENPDKIIRTARKIKYNNFSPEEISNTIRELIPFKNKTAQEMAELTSSNDRLTLSAKRKAIVTIENKDGDLTKTFYDENGNITKTVEKVHKNDTTEKITYSPEGELIQTKIRENENYERFTSAEVYNNKNKKIAEIDKFYDDDGVTRRKSTFSRTEELTDRVFKDKQGNIKWRKHSQRQLDSKNTTTIVKDAKGNTQKIIEEYYVDRSKRFNVKDKDGNIIKSSYYIFDNLNTDIKDKTGKIVSTISNITESNDKTTTINDLLENTTEKYHYKSIPIGHKYNTRWQRTSYEKYAIRGDKKIFQKSIEYTYNESGRTEKMTNIDGQTITDYDIRGRKIKTIKIDQKGDVIESTSTSYDPYSIRTLTYDAQGNIKQSELKDKAGNIIELKKQEHYPDGKIKQAQDVIGNTTADGEIIYNSNGREIKSFKKDENGNVLETTVSAYDFSGVRKTTTDSKNNIIKTEHTDNQGNLISLLEYSYNSKDKMTKFTEKDAKGNITYFNSKMKKITQEEYLNL